MIKQCYLLPLMGYFLLNNCYAAQELSNGITISGFVQQGNWRYYQITIPSQGSNITTNSAATIKLTNLSSDVDLYVSKEQEPNFISYDCRSYNGKTTDESCYVSLYILGYMVITADNTI